MAAHYNSLEVAKILLENGAVTEIPANNLFTALHIAAKKNHLEFAQILLDKGANVDAASVNGTTPLHLACESRHAGMANLLLKNGANINKKSHNGKENKMISRSVGKFLLHSKTLPYGVRVTHCQYLTHAEQFISKKYTVKFHFMGS